MLINTKLVLISIQISNWLLWKKLYRP